MICRHDALSCLVLLLFIHVQSYIYIQYATNAINLSFEFYLMSVNSFTTLTQHIVFCQHSICDRLLTSFFFIMTFISLAPHMNTIFSVNLFLAVLCVATFLCGLIESFIVVRHCIDRLPSISAFIRDDIQQTPVFAGRYRRYQPRQPPMRAILNRILIKKEHIIFFKRRPHEESVVEGGEETQQEQRNDGDETSVIEDDVEVVVREPVDECEDRMVINNECVICLEPTDMALRECNHTMCSECCQEYLKSILNAVPARFQRIPLSNHTLSCPVCRHVYTLYPPTSPPQR